MEWRILDAIGPFFRGIERGRINWSKIPFADLATEGPLARAQWDRIAADLTSLVTRARDCGFNAVTLDDLAHLVPHPWHGAALNQQLEVYRAEFGRLFRIIDELGMAVFLTTDAIPCSAGLLAATGGRRAALDAWFREIITDLLDAFPEVRGIILRIGESDGKDVCDPLRSRLHLKNSHQTQRFLRDLLPLFESRNRLLVFRTWTVGAHRIGDLIWHRRTLDDTLGGLHSPALLVSMKHGESDFFRYLPLNRAFFRVAQPKIIEIQARREYEGGGEFPSFIGWDCERMARELIGVKNLVGISVWCQTGGWHGFRRLAFLEAAGQDIWIRLNVQAARRILCDGATVEQVVSEVAGTEHAEAMLELLRHSETVMRELYYIEEFARRKLFFRRVRIPPLLHVYWDCLFINHALRKILRHFVDDPEHVIRDGEAAFDLFPRMMDLAGEADLPADDIEFMRDTFRLIALARRYYFLPYDPALPPLIEAAKLAYKSRWPRSQRQRYRIKTSFEPFQVKRRTLAWTAALLLRKRRGYRIIDRLFTLGLLGIIYRLLRPAAKNSLPKFLRESAMGIDTLFK
ncbi:MAG: hypothetical protein DVB26_05480 [Verrucomicrobia bacterium]|nr:MAG: hypothetical protein DVB26_05480 [Verrucomicrobiota bacterium]